MEYSEIGRQKSERSLELPKPLYQSRIKVSSMEGRGNSSRELGAISR
jgi:hypothetical protein